MSKKRSVLFLTLNTFSVTGGIEKVCRVAGKALNELLTENNSKFTLVSLHDGQDCAKNNLYFSENNFRGFGGNKIRFILHCLFLSSGDKRIIIMSHINLLPVGFLIKIFSPNTRLILFGHGIEIWPKLSFIKQQLLKRCNLILAVSSFTRDKIIDVNKIRKERVVVLNNCLDPFLSPPLHADKIMLREQMGFQSGDKILLALTRYSNKEKYKGYDLVIKVMRNVKDIYPDLKYILLGKYDSEEKLRIEAMAENLGLSNKIEFKGFVAETDLPAYFKMADVFVLPSEKEGFGIVFIEAMFYNLPVIAGNVDGSRDALLNGEMGMLVDPHNSHELESAIVKGLENSSRFMPDRSVLMNHFGFSNYKIKIANFLNVI